MRQTPPHRLLETWPWSSASPSCTTTSIPVPCMQLEPGMEWRLDEPGLFFLELLASSVS